MSAEERIRKCGILPVVVMRDKNFAVQTARALLDGGIDVIEVTFRTDAAEESIKAIKKELPEALVGAGTIINTAQAQKAIDAGAEFIVSPGIDPKLVAYVLEKGIETYPGTVTPSEIMAGIALGLKTFKFFPAEIYGGLNAMNALSGPFNGIRFLPTGGIHEANLEAYLSSPMVMAVGGSWMASGRMIENGEFESITQKAAQARNVFKSIRGATGP